jgi:hypothetical protein
MRRGKGCADHCDLHGDLHGVSDLGANGRLKSYSPTPNVDTQTAPAGRFAPHMGRFLVFR